jgi:hypothetical protein
MDYGDHTLYPKERARKVKEAKEARKKGIRVDDNQRRFRLIDFGRSKWVGDWSESQNVESEVNGPSSTDKERGRDLAEGIRRVDPKAWNEWYEQSYRETRDTYSIVNVMCQF